MKNPSDTVLFMFFRRMRRPLLSLLTAYAIAVLGLTLIPGRDADGNTWYMGFFHAIYFVSYMATTIGFGEIPREFSDAQRLWVTFSIYATVIIWLYAIGNLLALVQNQTFQLAVREKSFAKRIRRWRQPFFLICGYGRTGSELVVSLVDHDHHAVVIDAHEDRIDALDMLSLRESVPGLCADANDPIFLVNAGLQHKKCAGVVAVTNSNETNLKIAITAKMLNPRVPVICRADSHDVEANMASFGTDRIIDPYDTFGIRLATALQSPCLYLLQEWLTGLSDEPLSEPVYPPINGAWVVCGYGRFGKAIHRRLMAETVEIVVVEKNPDITGRPQGAFVQGRGTEAETLIEAGIEGAVGLVAGTDDDANNLSIIATAKEINPELFVIARKNHNKNGCLFDALDCNMVMNPSSIVANKIRTLLVSPMLHDFAGLASHKEDAWACELASRISGLITDEAPDHWEVSIDAEHAYAVTKHLQSSNIVTLGDILKNRYQPEETLKAIALMYTGHENRVLLPTDNLRLHPGARLLFCGDASARYSMQWNLQNRDVLEYLLKGSNSLRNPILKKLLRRK